MKSNKQILTESIDHLYKSILTESKGEYHIFFRRPLIKKGIQTLRSIWRNGGKSSAKQCKMGIRKNRKDILFVVTELLEDEKFHMYLRTNNLDRDLNKDVLKAIYFYVKGHGETTDGDARELDRQERSVLYKLNDNYYQLFVQTVLKFRRDILKNEKTE